MKAIEPARGHENNHMHGKPILARASGLLFGVAAWIGIIGLRVVPSGKPAAGDTQLGSPGFLEPSAAAARLPRGRDGFLGNVSRSVALVSKEDVGRHYAWGMPLVDDRPSCAGTLGWCEDEPLVDQARIAKCSGVLLSSTLTLTAEHCLRLFPPVALEMVVGLRNDEPSSAPQPSAYRFVRARSPTAIWDDGDPTTDWVLIEHKEFEGLGEVAWPAQEDPDEGDGIYTLGYPLGLPLKAAIDGTLTDRIDGTHCFQATVDALYNSSGSGVFLDDTHALVGLVVAKYGDTQGTATSAGCCRFPSRTADDVGIEIVTNKDVTSLLKDPKNNRFRLRDWHPSSQHQVCEHSKPDQGRWSLLSGEATLSIP